MATVAPAHGGVDAGVNLREVTAWVVMAFAFSIPFDEILSIPGIGSPTRLIGLIALPLGLVALVGRGRIRLRRPPLFVAVAALFVLWNVVTFYWSYAPSATIREASRFVQLFAFVWLMSEFCRERSHRLGLMQAFVLGNYVSFGITAFNVLVMSSGFRDVGPFNANQFSVILALGIPLAGLLMTERRPGLLHALNVIYPLIATFGVVLAASRSGLIVSLIALTVVPFVIARLSVLRRLLVLFAALAALWFSFALAPELFPELYANIARLQTTGDELTTGTLTKRTVIWEETFSVFRESPLIGVGSGAARFALVDTEIGRVKAVHNAYLSVATSTGLVGLLMFLALVALAAASALLAAPIHRPFVLILAVALVTAMVPANSEARKDTWFVLGLLAIQRPIVLSVGEGRRTSA